MLALIRYFGSKHSLARYYGPPQSKAVCEPFAGSAGYSSFWEPEKVILVEKDPLIAGMWRWLIGASHDDIMDLPAGATHIDDLKELPDIVRSWVGMWFALGSTKPGESFKPETKARRDAFWGENVRARIARNIHKCNGWEIIEGDYTEAPEGDYHYHVDPPYQFRGKNYTYGNKGIDYEKLAEWCLSKQAGEVCEAEGADWLPFEPFRKLNNQVGSDYNEVVYYLNKRGLGLC